MSTQTLPAQTRRPREIISYDPATGEEIGRAPLLSPEEVKAGGASGARGAACLGQSLFPRAGRVILQARELMLAERDEIALLISRETGKPVAEALSMEIVPTLDAMHYFAHALRRSAAPAENRHWPIRLDGPLVAASCSGRSAWSESSRPGIFRWPRRLMKW